MNNKLFAGIMMLFGTLLASISQILWKYGAEHNLLLIIILGYFIYGIFFVMMILAFKKVEMSFVYPFVALSFLWVAILSALIFNEQITTYRIIGLITIIFGIIFVGGSK